MLSDHARIPILRSRCLARCQGGLERALIDAASFRASEGLPEAIRVARRTRDRLAAYPFALDDLELLAGRPDRAAIPGGPGDLEAARNYLASLPFSSVPGQTGHCELDRALVLHEGLDRAEARLKGLEREAANAEKKETLTTFLIALDGLRAFFQGAARTAAAAKVGAAAAREKELEAMERCCLRLAHEAPATFREALQAVALIDIAVTYADSAGLCSPGHLDRSLWRFYEADRASGLESDEALLLLESFYVLINEFTLPGGALAIMVGGRDKTGKDVTNELSHLCLEAIRRSNLVYPTVGICWHEGTPVDLTRRAVNLIAQGYTTPALFGDETIQRGLQRYGLPTSEACHYVNSTCVEITPVGMSNVWVASPYFSLCRILLEHLAACVARGEHGVSFEAFIAGYQERLLTVIDAGILGISNARQRRHEHGGKPLQSLFTNDCVARGVDIDRGGARCNWVECSFVGLANLADSLEVVRREVFEEKRMNLAELHKMLASNFSGKEAVRQRFLHAHPKYGQGDAGVDGLVGRFVDFVTAACETRRVPFGQERFIAGAFCWVMHERLGAECGATPDGRHAGLPFADGCGPAQGRETRGPTTAILSTTSWDAHGLIGGAAFNMRFMKSLFKSHEEVERLEQLLLAYLRRGGFEVQVNVVDGELLRKAKENPEAYADLVVRIGGYTDYFTRLSPGMQVELMQRTEYAAL